MSRITVQHNDFNALYSEYKNKLNSIVESMRRSPIGRNGTYRSSTIKAFRRDYVLLYNTVLKVVQLMSIDWNIAKFCTEEVETFDKYYTFLIEGNVSGAHSLSYGCDALWNDSNVYATDISLDPIVLEDDSERYDNWVVTEAGIRDLDVIRDSIVMLQQASSDYKNSIYDFSLTTCIEGGFADAIKAYLSQVHVRLIDSIYNVGEELINAIRQYQICYEAEYPEGEFYFIKSELNDDIERINSILERYRALFIDARGIIYEANATLCIPGIKTYNGKNISQDYLVRFESVLSNSTRVLKDIIDKTDSYEDSGKEYAFNVQNDLMRIITSIEQITPMGGYRILNYRPSAGEQLFNNPYLDDIGDIQENHADYLSVFGMYVFQLENNTSETVMNDIREYIEMRVQGEGIITDELINSMVQYYGDLSHRWSPEQAEILVMYAASRFRTSLIHNNATVLERLVERRCPDPMIVNQNMSNFMVKIALDDIWGYELNAWGNAPRDEMPDIEAPGEIDCSHLVLRACQYAGIDISGISSTQNMRCNLETRGFTTFTCNDTSTGGYSTIRIPDDLQIGDILLNEEHHTAMYVGDGQIVEAIHTELGVNVFVGGELGDTGLNTINEEEIVMTNYHQYGRGGWNYVLRYTG